MVDEKARRLASLALSLVVVFQVLQLTHRPDTLRAHRIVLLDDNGRAAATISGHELGVSVFVKGPRPSDKDFMLGIQNLADGTHVSFHRYGTGDETLTYSSQAHWDLKDPDPADPVDALRAPSASDR